MPVTCPPVISNAQLKLYHLMGVERFELPKPQGNWVTASPDSPSPENTHVALQGGLEPP